MSSTPAVGTPTAVASSVSSNAPLPPSVPPSYTASSSFGVNTVSVLTSVTTSPTTPVTTSAFSNQSQNPSLASQTTMTAASAGATAPTSTSPSVPSSTISTTSARASSMSSSTPPAIAYTSSNANQSSTSIPEISIQPTTSTTTTPTTTQPSTSTSTPSTASLPSTTTSSTPVSAAPSTSDTPFTITSSPLRSDSSSQSSSPAGTDIQLTTVLKSTTIFITSTNSQGQVITSVPPVVTEMITTTGSGGILTTVTQAVVNPTLAPNNSTTEGSSFFADTGAVIGVFVVVGLAFASIMMWILFAIRRRQRMRGIEHDNVVQAAVAAAGLNRAPLDDDEDGSPISPTTYYQSSSGMGQRSTLLGRGSDSLPTSARLSEVLDDLPRDTANSHPGRPVEHRASSHPEGYIQARTTSPSPRVEQCTDDLGSSRDRKSSYGHTPTYSAGSFEPLLASYAQNMSDQDTSAHTIEPPRSRPSQHLGSGLVRNGYSSDGTPEDGSRRTSLKRHNSSDSSVLRDEEDYTRPVLTVRNVPDNQSQHSL